MKNLYVVCNFPNFEKKHINVLETPDDFMGYSLFTCN